MPILGQFMSWVVTESFNVISYHGSRGNSASTVCTLFLCFILPCCFPGLQPPDTYMAGKQSGLSRRSDTVLLLQTLPHVQSTILNSYSPDIRPVRMARCQNAFTEINILYGSTCCMKPCPGYKYITRKNPMASILATSSTAIPVGMTFVGIIVSVERLLRFALTTCFITFRSIAPAIVVCNLHVGKFHAMPVAGQYQT